MISVITTSKNIISEGREEFFRKAMESLYSQTYTDFEHILIDSNSTDGTQELLKEYKQKNQIDTLIVEEDNSIYEALNKGLEQAKGELIYFMTTDDYITDNKFFEKSVKAIEGYDFTHADREIIHRNGDNPTVKKGDERVAFFRMPFRYQTMLIRKEIYDEFGPMDEKYKIASDYKFMAKMILAEKKGNYLPETFICSLDGGITKNRELCIKEVSEVLFETYGKQYNLTPEECKQIYLRKISPKLFSKIQANITNQKILNSLSYCYNVIQKSEK